MAIFNLFSRRQKKLRGEVSDVYQYDDLPPKLKVQIVQIVNETIGDESSYNGSAYAIYEHICKTLCKEYGVFYLKEHARSKFAEVYDFFLNENDTEKCLDVIDLTFSIIDDFVRSESYRFEQNTGVTHTSNSAIEELNFRFKEAAFGYQFESGELIRVDSQYLHSDAVKPLLCILGGSKSYEGANDEFRSAHEHYRHKRYKECLNDCLKSFESLMKAIHDKHGWSYKPSDTSKKLINSCLENKLVPDYLQNQFSSIRSLLESGTPTVRNKEGGHGQGSEVTNVPEHLARYTLHLTATNLLFLANCEENMV
ncbi:hypothetical protein L4C42_18575 [Vibrio wakamikoensis]|uniref:STM4504/CBY_0614 family protein n=1 Tax=Vibrio wakamikoensis TaxID=2910251 RepID=UPI003D1E4F75